MFCFHNWHFMNICRTNELLYMTLAVHQTTYHHSFWHIWMKTTNKSLWKLSKLTCFIWGTINLTLSYPKIHFKSLSALSFMHFGNFYHWMWLLPFKRVMVQYFVLIFCISLTWKMIKKSLSAIQNFLIWPSLDICQLKSL